jgi:hypothetical protein
MHIEVLSEAQQRLLPLIKSFSIEYYLAGGTAIALYIAHRRSIDFDLFTSADIERIAIRNIITKGGFTIEGLLYESADQIHLIVNSIKMTFLSFPFKNIQLTNFNNIIRIPELLDLAAMKAYALGGRAKWKDYVDLYFILKDHYQLKELSARAASIFGADFNEKLLREQLCFFDDIDYSERVEYIKNDIDEAEIKKFLVNIATAEFK